MFVFDYLAKTERQYFPVGEVARCLNVHTSTVCRWANEGKLPCAITPGGHRRIARSTLLAFGASYNF